MPFTMQDQTILYQIRLALDGSPELRAAIVRAIRDGAQRQQDQAVTLSALADTHFENAAPFLNCSKVHARQAADAYELAHSLEF